MLKQPVDQRRNHKENWKKHTSKNENTTYQNVWDTAKCS